MRMWIKNQTLMNGDGDGNPNRDKIIINGDVDGECKVLPKSDLLSSLIGSERATPIPVPKPSHYHP